MGSVEGRRLRRNVMREISTDEMVYVEAAPGGLWVVVFFAVNGDRIELASFANKTSADLKSAAVGRAMSDWLYEITGRS